MNRWTLFGKAALIVGALMVTNQSCTNLDEELFSQVDSDAALQTKSDFISAMAGCYSVLYDFAGHNGVLSIQEVSSDEAIIPQRGGDWFDGGQWLRMHRHEYAPTEESFNNAWNTYYNGTGRCNLIIKALEAKKADIDGAEAMIAELRALRAFYFTGIMDVFGNAPLVTYAPGDGDEYPRNNTRAEIFDFVVSELNAVTPALSKDPAAMYSRMHYYAAKALLARVYLNAEVYTGTAKWAEAKAAAEEVISSGKYSLNSNYYDNFSSNNNETSTEMIFAVPFDNATGPGFVLPAMTLHYQSQKTFDLAFQPWNGYCTSAEFYNSYDDTDARKANFLAGQQFQSDGVTQLVDPGAEASDPDGGPLNFTPELNEHFPNCLRQAGARIGKYAFFAGQNENCSNDFPLLRYTDMILIKAEAAHRMGDGATALAGVNEVRARAGVAPYTEVTEGNLLAERGREFFYEGLRRQDLIRFGKYDTKKTTQQVGGNLGTKGSLFPIPTPQLNANPNLVQNPGY